MLLQRLFGVRMLILLPIALCLAVLIASTDVLVRALAVVPLVVLLVMRDVITAGEMRGMGEVAKRKR